MAVLKFAVNLPELLRAELVEACQECRCAPVEFAAQCLESVLASRRLPKVPAGTLGPRLGVRERPEPEGLGETRAALSPVDLPTVADVADLEDLSI